jgi:autotransporter-associated beta strand protein
VDNNATVYLNGSNTYTGPTTVQSGVLGGDGTIAGDVIVQNGATLTPGSEANAIGALSVGSLQLDAGATTAMSIAGTDVSLYDQVVALGNVNFGGALDIDFESAGFVKFDFWQLFSGATSSGHFSSISATGAYGDLKFQHVGGGEWQATGGSLGAGEMLLFFEQNSNPYVSAGQLVLVPEPSTIVFAGIGLLVVGWRRWSRRRSPQPSLDAVAV